LLDDPNGSVGAFFLPSPFGVFAVSPLQTGTGGQVSGEEVLFHEYVHHILLGNLDDPMPGWMSEGMAELFMNASLESDGGMIIGLGNSDRGYSLNRMGRWDAKRLFESGTKPPADADIDQLYAKGWLVMHYLLFSGKRPGEFAKFAAGMKRGLPQLQAAQEAFGDLGKFETELEFYRRRSTLPAIHIKPEQLKVVTGMSLRKLSPAEAQIMPLRLQSMVGVNQRTGPPLAVRARPIAARYPDSAFVQRAMAEMEFDTKNFELADAAINRALVADPNYVDALCMKGLLIGNRARREGKPALWREARAAILKANQLAPDMALPFVLYFDSFAASGGVPNKSAVDGLLRAIVVQPTYQDLRIKVGLHLIETGEPVRARQILAPVAFAPHTSQDGPLVKLMAEIDKGTRGEALVAKIGELKIKSSNLFDLSNSPKEDEEKKGDKAK
jgi:tetratricopeptide (TPR) repeat protein